MQALAGCPRNHSKGFKAPSRLDWRTPKQEFGCYYVTKYENCLGFHILRLPTQISDGQMVRDEKGCVFYAIGTKS